jgi:rRNA maturation RNase YbeY
MPVTSNTAINFYSEQINFTLKNKTLIRNWIHSAISVEKKAAGIINFIFCSDNYLLKLNKSFLNHNYYTDIITFNYSEIPQTINGDIFISIDRVKENAKLYKNSFPDELNRVMIHGILHLIGYDDTSSAIKKIMTSKEDYYLSLLR